MANSNEVPSQLLACLLPAYLVTEIITLAWRFTSVQHFLHSPVCDADFVPKPNSTAACTMQYYYDSADEPKEWHTLVIVQFCLGVVTALAMLGLLCCKGAKFQREQWWKNFSEHKLKLALYVIPWLVLLIAQLILTADEFNMVQYGWRIDIVGYGLILLCCFFTVPKDLPFLRWTIIIAMCGFVLLNFVIIVYAERAQRGKQSHEHGAARQVRARRSAGVRGTPSRIRDRSRVSGDAARRAGIPDGEHGTPTRAHGVVPGNDPARQKWADAGSLQCDCSLSLVESALAGCGGLSSPQLGIFPKSVAR